MFSRKIFTVFMMGGILLCSSAFLLAGRVINLNDVLNSLEDAARISVTIGVGSIRVIEGPLGDYRDLSELFPLGTVFVGGTAVNDLLIGELQNPDGIIQRSLNTILIGSTIAQFKAHPDLVNKNIWISTDTSVK
jgi:hypothetical protein